MRFYCTLFDINYLVKGLCLHESLMEYNSEECRLYILAMDEATVRVLNRLQKQGRLRNTEIIDLRDFTNEDIEKARANRTWQEFCWTMASVLCDGLMNENGLVNITYLDADLCFYGDPRLQHEKQVGGSIWATPHRIIPERASQFEANGKYNVGWVTFKRNETGQLCCKTWADQCLIKCDKETCGDQRYLDAWPKVFYCCFRETASFGVNAGPWNISQWKIEKRDGQLFIEKDELICYHFHEFKKLASGAFYYTGWPLQTEAIEMIYMPYCARYSRIEKSLEGDLTC
jgi:hypothetical protein